ncbi:formyl transferase [Verrucomicrobia bacterium]|nr:formyl transferase [Verrucomicrobiota bacterium]
MKSNFKLLLLASDCDTTRLVYWCLKRDFPNIQVVLEDAVSKKSLFRGRVRRIGFSKTIGQVLFLLFMARLLKIRSRQRVKEIISEGGVGCLDPIPSVTRIRSVNSKKARELIRTVSPDIVVVNGTRIIGSQTLKILDVPFINTHLGITPSFRGVHGGYWALVNEKKDLFGATIHFVDEGVDTGSVIRHVCCAYTQRDNYATYPYLQLMAVLPVLGQSLGAVLEGHTLPIHELKMLPSKIYYHPTLWEYLYNRIMKGIA